MIEIRDEVSGIDNIVENLLDEQSLQDEVLTLEQESDQLEDDVESLQEEVQGMNWMSNTQRTHKSRKLLDDIEGKTRRKTTDDILEQVHPRPR